MLELESSEFYYLEIGGKSLLFTEYEQATKEVKEIIGKMNQEINEDDVELYEVNIKADPWEIQEISWMKFALELLKGE